MTALSTKPGIYSESLDIMLFSKFIITSAVKSDTKITDQLIYAQQLIFLNIIL